MALASSRQDDWGLGIHRGRTSPPGAVYDAVNALINDEGLLFRRGGSAYKSSANAGSQVLGLAYAMFGVFGASILGWRSGELFALDPATTPVALTSLTTTAANIPRAWARGVGIADGFYVPNAAGDKIAYVDGSSAFVLTAGTLTLTPTAPAYVAAVGSPARLIVTQGTKAYFTSRGDPTTMDAGDFHQLDGNSEIIGADAVGDTCLLFSTTGVHAIQNMSLDPVDAYGNIEHQVSRVSDLILWGDPGIAGYAGSLVVPAIDDVWLFNLGEPPVPITGDPGNAKIRPLYRSYVKAGYQPGIAAVHRGHYWLPILNGNTLIDVLVCRLDRGAAWTRWSGHAAGGAYLSQIGKTSRTPKLLGVNGLRVTDLTSTLDPSSSNALEADSSTSDLVIETRDYPLGNQQPGFAKNARVRYELVDDGSGATAAPTAAIAYSSDQDAGVFTTLTEKGQQGGGTGWGVSDGSKYQWALVAKRRERLRLRLTVAGACASFVLRSVELLLRPSGKQ